ncbi:transposase [Xanthomonas translucens pv. undulosa]|uniref:integrase core domain-containing protein n=1 Tax=Xanthomonas campestris pv. translucens TaxID=343 RepID=UPI00071B766B|nr:integrase core domain-containing protein [Xanthomonas translucens]MBC3973483.1 transposase [Xanthomonas translucens pv. undulosa]QSQ51302.1 transposase [Xanthomonas translucens pv. undulosa]QSQ59780.1 transposase [Xanthomonas translucens pv. undulosa]
MVSVSGFHGYLHRRDRLDPAAVLGVELPTIHAHSRGFLPSMRRKGRCLENAIAERFFATLKSEEATCVYESRAAAPAAIASYSHGFYNPTHLHSVLGYLSPIDSAKKPEQAA